MKEIEETSTSLAANLLNSIKEQIEGYEKHNNLATIHELRGLYSDILLIEVKKIRNQIIDEFYGQGNQYNISALLTVVCDYYAVNPDVLEVRSRKREAVEPRQLIHWMLRRKVVKNTLSLEAIGTLTGGRDHATVMHSVRTINNRLEFEQDFREDVMRLCNQLGAKTFWNGRELKVKRFDAEEKESAE